MDEKEAEARPVTGTIFLVKCVCIHFAPGSNGRSFPLEYL